MDTSDIKPKKDHYRKIVIYDWDMKAGTELRDFIIKQLNEREE